MPAFNVAGAFELKVSNGRKRCAITRRSAKPGQFAIFFVGLTQRFARAPITQVDAISIEARGASALRVKVEDRALSNDEVEALARANGFESRWELRAHYAAALPLKARLVTWDPTRMEAA